MSRLMLWNIEINGRYPVYNIKVFITLINILTCIVRPQETSNSDMARVLNSGSNKRPNKLCKVRVHYFTTLHGLLVGVGAHALVPSAAHGICGILKEEREKNCEAIFVYQYPLARSGLQYAGRAPHASLQDTRTVPSRALGVLTNRFCERDQRSHVTPLIFIVQCLYQLLKRLSMNLGLTLLKTNLWLSA